jgi:hypothetical protein
MRRRHIPKARTGARAPCGAVLLCGGAVNSPYLLQLFDVGTAALMYSFGLSVVNEFQGWSSTSLITKSSVSSTGLKARCR